MYKKGGWLVAWFGCSREIMVVKVLGYNWFSVVVWMWKIVPVVFSFLCEGFRNICRWRMVVVFFLFFR
jgi:hypothetical protein